MKNRAMSTLVWVQSSVAALLEDPAPGLEILPFPDDIASGSPRLGEVELIVLRALGRRSARRWEHLHSLQASSRCPPRASMR